MGKPWMFAVTSEMAEELDRVAKDLVIKRPQLALSALALGLQAMRQGVTSLASEPKSSLKGPYNPSKEGPGADLSVLVGTNHVLGGEGSLERLGDGEFLIRVDEATVRKTLASEPQASTPLTAYDRQVQMNKLQAEFIALQAEHEAELNAGLKAKGEDDVERSPRKPSKATGLEDVPPMLVASITQDATSPAESVSDTERPEAPFEAASLTDAELAALPDSEKPNPFDALNEPAPIPDLTLLSDEELADFRSNLDQDELDAFAESLLEDA